jgi:hypothetical protein
MPGAAAILFASAAALGGSFAFGGTAAEQVILDTSGYWRSCLTWKLFDIAGEIAGRGAGVPR